MESTLLYIKEEDFITTKKSTCSNEVIYSIRSELNKMAHVHLFSLEAYKKLVRKRIGMKNKIPIYFTSKLVLFYITEKGKRFLINYSNIFKICYLERIEIIFINGEILHLEVSRAVLEREIKKIKKLEEYILNLNL